ncbi:class I SAM-dependent methyltransferase [Helicobacter himalayensis]|uniref:class I SAM-dependent methyltransferase n=1 Tax=Helicobacter himalayensis TaxID=1591088 RepID=UPI003D6EE1F4
MTINLQDKPLTPDERVGVQALLDSQNPAISDDLEQIWYLMDKVWDEMGCDNKNLDWDKIALYYKHPIWLLNGLFVESHKLSISVRKAIARYIAQKGFKRICDYGGGFGTLAKEIALACPDSQIDIYEPFPSEYGKHCIAQFSNIHFVSELKANTYDCLVSTDVLEHVDNVLECFESMLDSVKIGGEALIGNCFYPVIKCHLPKNFHYRYTFKYFARAMGVRFDGIIKNTGYVESYTKIQKADSKSFKVVIGGGGKQTALCANWVA